MKHLGTTIAVVVALITAVVASAPAGGRTTHPSPPRVQTRYSLVHGCYRVRLASGRRLGPLRMQAAALGKYLLYGVHGNYLGAGLALGGRPRETTIGRS